MFILFFYYFLLKRNIDFFFFIKSSQKQQSHNNQTMNDFILYTHIKNAIKEKKLFGNTASIKDDKNFVEQYIRRQLAKKRIGLTQKPNSNHVNDKMNLIMKNFKHVETYIDLNDLILQISALRKKQVLQQKKKQLVQQQMQSHKKNNSIKATDNNQVLSPEWTDSEATQNSYKSLLLLQKRIRNQLNCTERKRFDKENKGISEMIDLIGKNSKMSNIQSKNHSNNYISHLNQTLDDINNEHLTYDSNELDQLKIFNEMIELNQFRIKPIFDRKQSKDDQFYVKPTLLNSKQKRQDTKLLHKISTFLQIALENQHKQKWSTKDQKSFRSTHGSFRFRKGQQAANFFLQDVKKKSNPFSQLTSSQADSSFCNSPNRVSSQASISSKSSQSFNGNRSNSNMMQSSNTTKYNQNANNLRESQIKNIKEDNEKSFPRINIIKATQDYQTNQRKCVRSLKRNIQATTIHNKNCIQYRNNSSKKESKLFVNKKQNSSMKTSINLGLMSNIQKKNMLNSGSNQYCFPKKSVKNRTLVASRQSFHNRAACIQTMNTTAMGKGQKQKQNSIPLQCIRPCRKERKTQNSHTTAKRVIHNKIVGNNSKHEQNSRQSSIVNSRLCESFTFKNRNKKIQILKKIGSFIQQITEEENSNKKENQYYGEMINKLQQISQNSYESYEQPTLAGNEQVNELKQFVNKLGPAVLREKVTKEKSHHQQVKKNQVIDDQIDELINRL